MSQDMTICGLEIKRGTKLRAMLPVPDTMTKIPLTVINGVEDGPTLLITDWAGTLSRSMYTAA